MPQSSGSKASNWQAESLRLTVFLATNVQLRDEGWWTKVAGTDPENRIAKPNRGEIVEAGIFQGNVLTLSVQPGRVDWILGPNMSIEDDLGEIKSVGSFRSAETTFSATMSDWLKDCPSTVRLAYGAVLLEPVENREKGYLRVAEYVPAVKIDPLGSEDFLYQINRPRESTTVKGMRLNRLSKWSVASFQPVRFSIGIPQSQPRQPLVYSHGGTLAMACRAEFDLSTAAGIQQELPHDMLPRIFNELVALGSEIAQYGDMP
ncbi:MAG: hypothetical protein DMG96_40570 [Acidobacteria bacterium]|nr:MAG: hypothetical protein DMG96_40570 [Acidobacteriota bacterium]